MVERSEEPGLDREAAADRRVGGEGTRQLLDGHVAPELAVASGQDDSPPAAAELAAHLVVRKGVDDLLQVECHDGGNPSPAEPVLPAGAVPLAGASPPAEGERVDQVGVVLIVFFLVPLPVVRRRRQVADGEEDGGEDRRSW